MKVKGKVYFIGETKKVSDSFRTRELVVITEDQYPQTIPLKLTQENCDIADALKLNQHLEASINIRGREWVSPEKERRFYCSLEAWRIEVLDESSTEKAVVVEKLDVDDDLPF
jgi:hypothetical protein